MPSHLRILIADDHELIREGLKRVLIEDPAIEFVGEARDAAETLEIVRAQPWSLVLLDIGLPGRNGLEALKEIKKERPRLPVILLSMYPEEQFGVRGLRAGADGYLTKGAMVRVIREAIHQVLAGRKYVSASLASKLLDVLNSPSNVPPHETLSDRENEVFLSIGGGKTVGEIAADLRLSVKTISTYRTNILKKLGLENNAQIMKYVADHHLQSSQG